jgi:hypothetical protein
MLGSRPQGKPRMGMIDELREVVMKAAKKKMELVGSMNRRAEDREGWRIFVPRTCRKAEN